MFDARYIQNRIQCLSFEHFIKWKNNFPRTCHKLPVWLNLLGALGSFATSIFESDVAEPVARVPTLPSVMSVESPPSLGEALSLCVRQGLKNIGFLDPKVTFL